MATGISQWPGKAVRWTFWRLPKGAARYTWNSNLALANDIGRRVAIFLVFGAYLWGVRWVCVRVFPVGHIVRAISAVLLLIWFWHGLSLIGWIIHARVSAARERAWRREQTETLEELRNDMRQTLSNVANRLPGGSFTVPYMTRHHDPTADEHARMAREQAAEARSWLPEEHRDMPLGDKFEPLVSWPRFLRRRRGKP